MLDVSFSELALIGIVALVVVGPQKLPALARTVGHLLGRAQRYISEVKTDMERELEIDKLQKIKGDITASWQQTRQTIHSGFNQLEHEIKSGLDLTSAEPGPALTYPPNQGTNAPASHPIDASASFSLSAHSKVPELGVQQHTLPADLSAANLVARLVKSDQSTIRPQFNPGSGSAEPDL